MSQTSKSPMDVSTNSTSLDEKYIVFKRDEFANWYYQESIAGTEHDIQPPEALKDVWVTRVQDRFATVVGFAYSNAIQNAIDVLHTLPAFKDNDLANDAIPRLKKILEAANDFAMKAQLATMNRKTKLPD